MERKAIVSGSGIIPAYAGSTSSVAASRRPRADHPRIRGEHYRHLSYKESQAGSSPHTRGARRRRIRLPRRTRIIPAYAGSTTSGSSSTAYRTGSSPHTRGARQQNYSKLFTSPDHPRIRGEHHWGASICRSASGSSPHTRGALLARLISMVRSRIIPAYAGSTSLARGGFGRPADHPRGCA